MARVHQSAPQIINRPPQPAPTTPPPWTPLFRDTIRFADDVLGLISRLSSILQHHRDIAVRERILRNFQDLRSKLHNARNEVIKLSEADYNGLQAIFENPRQDGLGDLRKHIQTISLAATELAPSLEALGDQNTQDVIRTFQEQAAGLEYRTTQALRSPQAQSNGPTDTSLCPTALRLLEGDDDGVINYIDTKFLERPERDRLFHDGGSFQYWKCEDCKGKYEQKFYVRKARNATLERTEDTTSYPEAEIRYRAILLAKSHVRKNVKPFKFACVLCLAQRHKITDPDCGFKTEKGLLKHIGRSHNCTELPRIFMEKLRFSATGIRDNDRYDLKFMTT